MICPAMAAGTPRRQILFKVVLPAAVTVDPYRLPHWPCDLMIVVFLAEMITSTDGSAHLLVTAGRTFQAVDMFVPLITNFRCWTDSQRACCRVKVRICCEVSEV